MAAPLTRQTRTGAGSTSAATIGISSEHHGKNTSAEGVGPPHRASRCRPARRSCSSACTWSTRSRARRRSTRCGTRGWKVARPDRTFATVDHIIPTASGSGRSSTSMAEDMIASLERNCRDFGVRLAGLDDDRQGIVHVIGPELGLTQPGMTIACGDSHTSTHGAFGSVAFGIGTSQVRDVLASQCLALEPMKVRRIRVTGTLPSGVYAKDVILDIIQRARRARRHRLRLRVRRRRHRADDDGRADDDLQHVDRRGRARRLRQPGRDDVRLPARAVRLRPQGEAFDRAMAWWRSIASDARCGVRRRVVIRAEELAPVVTWGVNPGQSISIDERVPSPTDAGEEPQAISDALDYMGLHAGDRIAGLKVDVAFIGSCTNARLSDLREAARVVQGPPRRAPRQGAGRARFRRRSAGQPSVKGWTRCSARLDSSGAPPVARCAWG